jgi:hypothetical protein
MTSRRAQPMYFMPAAKLPHGFKYPEAYRLFVADRPICVGPTNEDWCFIDEVDVDAFFAYARRIVPHLPLVPFMRRNGEDGVACFDGTCGDGNPKVYEFNYCVAIGFRGGQLTFTEWLALIPPKEEDDEA